VRRPIDIGQGGNRIRGGKLLRGVLSLYISNMSTTDDNTAGGSEEITSNKKEYTSCEQNNVDNITEGIASVAILNDMSACANCGKEGNSSDMNTCNKCKMVKYCNAACKKKHRSKHKKACERRVAELHEEALFKEPPSRDECPICMLTLPINANQSVFKSCCGKIICNGCICAMKMSEGKDLCAFCRMPPPSSVEEIIKRMKKLMDKGNAEAIYNLAGYYEQGSNGLAQDYQKARELTLKAGELGCAGAYFNLGNSYNNGMGVELDKKKAIYYWELAAIKGHVKARHNLGVLEGQAGNHQRAFRHTILSARAGHKGSLDAVKKGFVYGKVFTKVEYADTLRAYHERQKEMKSEERDMVISFL